MLKNKTAAVTGGTRGIGLAIVKKYLENGANVVVMGSRSMRAGSWASGPISATRRRWRRPSPP